MCGITGFCDFTKSIEEEVLQAMTKALAHRGPDADGIALKTNAKANIGLGHRRLSILDLSSNGNQPMYRGELSIVFNGEIYNFQEIKEELLKSGYVFRSNSDTEVILAAYEMWGMQSVNKFIGMFSYALFDGKTQMLYLVRDRVGVKPLYYYQSDDTLLFASELKSFHKYPNFVKSINTNALAQYLKYSYVPAPYSIFQNTFKVRPGHYIEYSTVNATLNEIKYWDVVDAYNQPKLKIDYNDAVIETQKRLETAFLYRMVSDVPVGVFLSGGYDSTVVTALLQKNRTDRIKTFTIGYNEDAFNEAKEAAKIANYLGTDHTEYYAGPQDAMGILEDLPHVFDEPFADNSVIPTLLVSKLARQHVKVALSGDGGDEIFGGYDKFTQSIKYAKQFPNFVQSLLSSLMGTLDPRHIPYFSNTYNFTTRYEKMKKIWKSHSPFLANKYIAHYITDDEINRLLKIKPEPVFTYFDIENELLDINDDLNKLLAIDYKTFLMDNNLTKIDRTGMSVSLEGREPFLDQNVIEFVSRLPSDYKIRKGVNKALLKDIVHNYVPPKLMDRPKMPFIAPLDKWFKNELKDLVIEYVSEDTIKNQGVFNVDEVIKMRDDYLSGKKVSHRKMWNILLFQLWYNKWM